MLQNTNTQKKTASGINCSPGAKSQKGLDSDGKLLCTVGGEQMGCWKNQIRISDSLQHPEQSCICVVFYCLNPKTRCQINIEVAFYDGKFQINFFVLYCTPYFQT